MEDEYYISDWVDASTDITLGNLVFNIEPTPQVAIPQVFIDAFEKE